VVGTLVPHPFCKEKQTMKNITILAIIGLIIYGFFSYKESKTKSYQKKQEEKTAKSLNITHDDTGKITQSFKPRKNNLRVRAKGKVIKVFSDDNKRSRHQRFNITHDDTGKIAQAFKFRKNNLQVRAKGKVIKVLSDDNKGSRHQRFILELKNKQTLLIAHNIDLAPKIANLKKGDFVVFYGEYEYNIKGGVIHWTHHDSKGWHVGGWLKHNGKIYQ